jgi:pentatricopeptide repeat protein
VGGPAHSGTVVENGFHHPQHNYYSTAPIEREEGMEEDEIDERESAYAKLADNMTVEELYQQISSHLKQHPRIRTSWFNKLLVKVNTRQDFARALDTLEIFTQRIIEISPETGTLFIKAACRAEEPEKALAILRALDKVRIWPTLGGIHYLMINFSLKKDTQAVKDTFAAAMKRNLKPNVRTYQIIIRECVDNNLIDDALIYFQECEKANIVPNRVTYNILMNGLRKAERPKEILSIREKMDKFGLEINETTVKFTSLAYMMLNDANKAVAEFLKFPELNKNMEQFCSKFFEVTEEPNPVQKKCVVDLFDALAAKGTSLPPSVTEKVVSLKSSLA